MQQIKRNQGFTLVELMVTIAVLAIMAMMAAPSFSNMLMSQNLKSTAFNMKDTLKEARSRAMLNRNETVVCTSINKAGATVTIAECGAMLTGYTADMSASLKDSSVLMANIENKIILKTTSDDFFIFSPRGNLNATNKTVTFCSPTESYVLSVSMAGFIDITQGGACS